MFDKQFSILRYLFFANRPSLITYFFITFRAYLFSLKLRFLHTPTCVLIKVRPNLFLVFDKLII